MWITTNYYNIIVNINIIIQKHWHITIKMLKIEFNFGLTMMIILKFNKKMKIIKPTIYKLF